MATSNSKDAAPQRKIIDVNEPGKTAPPSSAKPIIVSNRPVLRQDPMVVAPPAEDPVLDAPSKSVERSSREMRIEPLTVAELAKAAAAAHGEKPTAEADEPPDKSADDKPAPTDAPLSHEEPASKPVTEPQAATPSDDAKPVTPPTTDAPVAAGNKMPAETGADKTNDSLGDEHEGDDQLAPNQAIDEAKKKEEEAKAAVLAEQEKIIESKQFYLPINNVEKKRRGFDRVILLLVLVIALGLVWIDLVLDAGLVQIHGVHALTHFFQH